MRRKRSLPWIYRWSRPLMGGIAIAGALLTGYLTFVKLTGGDVVCSADAAASSSCSDVLSSPYASVFGQPLSLFGCLAYISMAIFALSPLVLNQETQQKLRKQLEDWTWLLLLAGGFAMTVFSGYLMYVLAFEIQSVCYYCIGSAIFSLSFLVLTLTGRAWDDIGQVLFTGVLVGMVTFVGTLGVYAGINSPESLIITSPTTRPQPPNGWEVTTTSGETEIALAEYLTAQGIKKYGAYWCPHCYEQKQLFGKEAFNKINYIECAEGGTDAQPQTCLNAGIKSYPTWEINGELYPGTQTLEKLTELSGYQGATDFKYQLSQS